MPLNKVLCIDVQRDVVRRNHLFTPFALCIKDIPY